MREILEFTAHWQKEALYLLHVDGLYCLEKLVHSVGRRMVIPHCMWLVVRVMWTL